MRRWRIWITTGIVALLFSATGFAESPPRTKPNEDGASAVQPAADRPLEQSPYDAAMHSTALVIAGECSGSGVVIDTEQRLLITSFHVVGVREEVMVCFPQYRDGEVIAERRHYITGLGDLGIRGRVTVRDPRRDLALVQLESLPDRVRGIPLAESSPRPGDTVYSIGNPNASEALWGFTSGTVRQVYQTILPTPHGYEIEARMIETQSPVNPGDSGGPLLDAHSQLVGIVCAFRDSARLVSYCVDISEVRSLLGGDLKTIDRRVASALETAGLKHTVNMFGIFQIPFPRSDGQVDRVFVHSETARFRNMEVRKVEAVVSVTAQPIGAALGQHLLTDSANFKLGSWCVRQIHDKYYVIFVVRVDAGLDAGSLRDTIELVLAVLRHSEANIEKLAVSSAIQAHRIAGQWTGNLVGEKQEPVALKLEFTDNGRFVWEEPSVLLRGTFAIADGFIVAMLNGQQHRLAAVCAVDDDRLVLKLRGQEVIFQRQAAAAQPETGLSETLAGVPAP